MGIKNLGMVLAAITINPNNMQLTMYIGNRLIDIISLNPESIKAEGYIKELKYRLEKAHEKIITTLQVKPVYMIETNS